MAAYQPDNLPTLLRVTYFHYCKSFKALFIVSFMIAVLKHLVMVGMLQFVEQNGLVIELKDQNMLTILSVVFILVCFFGNAVIKCLLNQHAHKMPMAYRDVCFFVLRKLFPLFIAGCLVYGAALLGIMWYVIPGLLVGAFFCLYEPAMLFEDKGIFDSILYSYYLAKPYFFKMLSIFTIAALLEFLPDFFVRLFFQSIDSSHAFGLDQAAEIFIDALMLPFVNGLILCTFYQLKEAYQTR